MHEVLFLGKTKLNAQIQKDWNGTGSVITEKKWQMADPLGTLNEIFGEEGETVLFGHIDSSGLGKCWSGDSIGETSARELSEFLLFPQESWKKSVWRTAIRTINCLENMVHKKDERLRLFSLGNNIFRGKGKQFWNS